MDSQRTQRVGEARQRALSFHFASKQSQDKSSLLPSLHAPSTVGFRSTFACWNRCVFSQMFTPLTGTLTGGSFSVQTSLRATEVARALQRRHPADRYERTHHWNRQA